MIIRNSARLLALIFPKRYFCRHLSGKRESYFAAIGGDSDEPPPGLTKEQVTRILSASEASIKHSVDQVRLIECNQLASNHPIEDRMRVARLNYETIFLNSNSNNSEHEIDGQSLENFGNGNSKIITGRNRAVPTGKLRSLLCAVFDGHGGETCADLITSRLFAYIAVAILSCNYSQQYQGEAINAAYLEGLSTEKFAKLKSKVIEDLCVRPQLQHSSSSVYDQEHWDVIKNHVAEEEQAHLVRFARTLNAHPVQGISEAIRRSFVQCDEDLSEEIERNLSVRKSNLLSHYYFSLAASGSCVSLLYLTDDCLYVASSGDCKTILAVHEGNADSSRLIQLGSEHDADNLNEIKRIMDAHPTTERNFLLKNNRLLGQLMPLRAFGDFSYKWTTEKMQKVGLTRAFGPHIIPPNYYTPPYLIVEPEIIEYSLKSGSEQANNSKELSDVLANDESQKFIVIATDGLWEQFANLKQIMKTIVRHQNKLVQLEPSHKNPQALQAQIDKLASFDRNSATYLLRNALGQTYLRNFDAHIETDEILRQQHERLVSFLTLPPSVVRNFRDDISVIVIYLK